jgi:hypothetical protein
MKTASKKTSAATASGASQASSAAIVGKVEDGLVDKQPEVKEKAAVAHAMFLFTNDAWAQRYYDPNDLHFLEREVFG